MEFTMLNRTLLTVFFCTVTFSSAANTIRQSTGNQALVSEVIAILKEHVITKDQINWDVLESEALVRLGDASSIETRNDVIYYLLKEVKTNHSFYRFAESGKVIRHADFNCRIKVEDWHTLPDDIGYIRVDSFGSIKADEMDAFAESVQAQIIEQDAKQLKGWVIDLRRNSGGNMWPMLAGVSSFLEDGIRGHFIKPNGVKTQWGVYEGASFLDNRFQVNLKQAYQLKNTNKPIAVLGSKRTSSSGEAMLIAFKGTKNTRFIGGDSCGLATANRGFTLQNGDILFVTTAIMSDRTNREYPVGIKMDELSDSPLLSAEKWIGSMQ